MSIMTRIRRHLQITRAQNMLRERLKGARMTDTERLAFLTSCSAFIELDGSVPPLYIAMAARAIQDNRVRDARNREVAE